MDISILLEKFCQKYPLVSYQAGQAIVSPGDKGYVYFLKSGLAKQSQKFFISFHQPGSFFPLASTFSSSPCPYLYQAFRASKAYQVPASSFMAFINSHPEALSAISRRLLEIIDRQNSRLQLLSHSHSGDRLIMFFLLLGKYFGQQKNGEVVIKLPLSHQEISGWIGTTRETVSWQMLELKKRGLIKYSRQQIVLLQLPRLQEAVNFA